MREEYFPEKLALAADQNIKERNFWLKTLAGEPAKSIFPYDHKKAAEGKPKYQPTQIKFKFPQELSTKMTAASNQSDHALHIILAAGLMGLLERYIYHTHDIIIGSPIYKQEIEGQFINTVLPLRTRLNPDITFKELLTRVKQTIVAAVENQNYPMEYLIRQLNWPGTGDDFPLFDIAILLENIHNRDHIRHINPGVTFVFQRSGETIEGEVEYNSSRYEESTMRRITDHYIRLLQEALFNPDRELSTVEILSPQEKKQLLEDFNDTAVSYPGNESLHALFARQEQEYGGKPALVYGGRELTYSELEMKANRLARHLENRGVKPGEIVAIMIEPSIEMIIGLLAILKAGAAYLSVDAKVPLKRIISMLENCRVSFLLTGKDIHEEYSITALMDLKAKPLTPYRTKTRDPIPDLDKLPLANRSLVNYDIYNQYNGMAMVKNKICLQASRGCPYKCTYCHKVWPKTHVFRSAEHIYNEVKLYYDMGVRRFAFVDDIFNLDRENTARFYKLIIKNGLDVHFMYPNGIRGDILTEDYIDLMMEAGTINMSFALETASPRLQKLIRKNLNLDRFRHNLEYTITKYPYAIVDLFTMHGFPTETKEEAMMTLNFIKSMKWLHFPFIWILKVFPNTDIEKLALENGVTPEEIAGSDHRGYHELPLTLPWETRFTLEYQTDFLNNYFLNKERLLHVLPHQMKLLTEDEIVQKYDGYFSADLKSFQGVLDFLGVKQEELQVSQCQPDDYMYAPNLYNKMKAHFTWSEPEADALRVLLLDVNLFFSDKEDNWRSVIEPPLGLMYLLTYLNQQFGGKVKGKIAKTRFDYDSFEDLLQMMDEFNPQVIGIRGLSLYKDFLHQTAAVIRQRLVDVPIIVGGPYPTTSFDSILQDKNIDIVVFGEGEVTFAHLIEEIMGNNGRLPGDEVLKNIPGIAFMPQKSKPGIKFLPQIVMIDYFETGGDNYQSVDRSKARQYKEFPMLNPGPHSLAYLIYTSGSTGKPKGVMVNHGNVARLVKNSNYIRLKEDDRLLLTGAIGFDITTFEIWAPLLNGITLYLVDKEVLLDGPRLKEFIDQNQITILHLIPQLFNQLALQQPEIFAGLRYFLVGGDVVPPGNINLVRNKYPQLKIVQMYGPTENTTFSTFFPIHQDYEDKIPIGKPIGNSSAYIVDANYRLQPIGVPGELWTAGDGIAMGYMNQPELTAEKFLSITTQSCWFHGDNRPGRIYRTGDLARWLPDGNIEFLGRIDQQLKVRGFRIEIGEIESILSRHKEVRECVVVSRELYGENQLIAYYKKKNKIQLWPTMAEYLAYDDLLYHSIAHDEERNKVYHKAIQKAVKGKTVLEIGPGNEAILSRMCIEAGAKKVYAVEILEDAYKKAKETVKQLKLEDKIILMHGDITNVKLPGKVDYCVSEIVGTIGGAEGAAKLINLARQQLQDPRCMIPARSVTHIAAITLPADEFDGSFEEGGAYYVERTFAHVGRKFDLRMCLLSFPGKNLISTTDIFEELDFTKENVLEEKHDIFLEITRDAVFNGFIVYLHLYCDAEEMIDTLAKKYIWLPVYFPVFFEGESVQKGDYIKANVTRKLSANNLNPDFILEGTLYKKQEDKALDFTYHALHNPTEFKGNSFYQKIFSKEKLRVTEETKPVDIRRYLAGEVPEYMIPSYLIPVETFPLTPSGKIDRKALPLPEKLNLDEDFVGPRNEVEQRIVDVWKQVLNREKIGIHNNFFEIGGDSLKAMSATTQLSKEFDITINHIFQYGTAAAVAEKVSWKKDNLENKIETIKNTLQGERVKMEPAAEEQFKTQQKQVNREYKEYLDTLKSKNFPSLKAAHDYGDILVTGGTGFLGAHLVHELLKTTKARLHLLVRGQTQGEAEKRLEKKLAFYFQEDFYAAHKERLHVVSGDLRKDRLGIGGAIYEKLAGSVEAVVHAAANVSHFGIYDRFYQDNVEGTVKLLEFASNGIKKDIHYISTLSVANGNVEGKHCQLFTESCHDVGQIIDNVYVKTKLEAEKKILLYRKKGINASIYRVGGLVFHSGTGRFQENIGENAFYAQMKAFISMGVVPDIDGMVIDMTFIDYAARALVMLMIRQNLRDETFHLHNPHIITWKEMVPLLDETGIKIQRVNTEQFFDRLKQCLEDNNTREIVQRLLLHSGLFEEGNQQVTQTTLVSDRTLWILKKLGFKWLKPTGTEIGKMIENCRQVGYLK